MPAVAIVTTIADPTGRSSNGSTRRGPRLDRLLLDHAWCVSEDSEVMPLTLRILGIVDLHWAGHDPLRLPDLSEIDLVLLGGDLTHFRGTDVARRIIEEIRGAGAGVLAVCGNCDRPEIETYLEDEGIALDRTARLVGGATFVGLSGGLPFGGCPYERSEQEFAAACDEARVAAGAVAGNGPTILVSHQPPFGTRCDRVLRLKHVGSRSIRRLVEDLQPDLVLCGHIHESRGRDAIGETVVVNPGPWKSGHSIGFSISGSGVELQPES
jgi:Icc-related predicted phosphoesterase